MKKLFLIFVISLICINKVYSMDSLNKYSEQILAKDQIDPSDEVYLYFRCVAVFEFAEINFKDEIKDESSSYRNKSLTVFILVIDKIKQKLKLSENEAITKAKKESTALLESYKEKRIDFVRDDMFFCNQLFFN